jgi:hypothetical protein
MPTGLSTSIAAPVSDKLRTVQLMLPPPKFMIPALRTLRRGAIRLLSIEKKSTPGARPCEGRPVACSAPAAEMAASAAMVAETEAGRAVVVGKVLARVRSLSFLRLNKTYCGQYFVPCFPGHPLVCRCYSLGPKNRGLRERLTRPRTFASHSPFELKQASFRHEALVGDPVRDVVRDNTAFRPILGGQVFNDLRDGRGDAGLHPSANAQVLHELALAASDVHQALADDSETIHVDYPPFGS